MPSSPALGRAGEVSMREIGRGIGMVPTGSQERMLLAFGKCLTAKQKIGVLSIVQPVK